LPSRSENWEAASSLLKHRGGKPKNEMALGQVIEEELNLLGPSERRGIETACRLRRPSVNKMGKNRGGLTPLMIGKNQNGEEERKKTGRGKKKEKEALANFIILVWEK